MPTISRLFLAASVATAAAAVPLAGEALQVRIQRRVSVTTIPVFVTDGRDRFASGLTIEDFQLIEDGTQQELTAFDERAAPLAVVLAVDTSASMSRNLPVVKKAAPAVVNVYVRHRTASN